MQRKWMDIQSNDDVKSINSLLYCCLSLFLASFFKLFLFFYHFLCFLQFFFLTFPFQISYLSFLTLYSIYFLTIFPQSSQLFFFFLTNRHSLLSLPSLSFFSAKLFHAHRCFYQSFLSLFTILIFRTFFLFLS